MSILLNGTIILITKMDIKEFVQENSMGVCPVQEIQVESLA